MQHDLTLTDRFVIGVDVEMYSARNVRQQIGIQRAVDELLATAARGAGLDRDLWIRQPGGDGELAVLPPGVDLLSVVTAFVRTLDQGLTDHNDDHSTDLRIRLRVAMHIGTVTPAALGGGGQALIVLSRLLDCGPLRRALKAHPQVGLALILSSEVYEKAVLSELAGLRSRQFTEVQVDLPAKGFHRTAYVHLPGIDGDAVQADDPASAAPSGPSSSSFEEDRGAESSGPAGVDAGRPGRSDQPSAGGAEKAVYNTFNDRVNMPGSILGFAHEGD